MKTIKSPAAYDMPSPHVSPGFVARPWRRPQIQVERTEGDVGIVEHYVEEPEAGTAWRCGCICAHSRKLVKYAG